ncbi:MAG TPA: type II CAAX endopeptidase family protein [Terriglobales bacterium]|nr:type II CAAX endopeptidase family protein [Terriglobales bacterium]
MAELQNRITEPDPCAAPPNDGLAAELRGFGPVGIFALVAITFSGYISLGRMVVFPLGGILALVWVWLSHTPWSQIGYVRPRSWLLTMCGGAALGITLKLLMKAVVMPLLGADPVNSVYHFLSGNRALLGRAVSMMVIAGFAEETVFRGYLFERFSKLLGSSKLAKACIVLMTSLWFGLGHYADQRLAGVEQAFITGLIFGSIFVCTGSVFLPMIAHAAFDITAVVLIYRNLETQVAHWIFR